ncbi:MAG: nucleotidyltransferase family protein [Parvibaculales bacterium]
MTGAASLKTSITTAMVLAAGRGTRMRASADAPPKPLTPLAGRTLLDRMIDKLVVCGVERIIVNVHFKADWIEAHLEEMASNHCEIIISDERSALLETGGGVLHARALLGDVPFYVCNADVFWREDHNNLLSLAEHFDATRMAACLLLADRGTASGFDGAGDFFMTPQGKLSRRGTARAAPWVYAGAQIVRPDLLNQAPTGQAAFSFNAFWDAALSEGGLFGLPLQGEWMHIGTPDGLAAAERRLSAD